MEDVEELQNQLDEKTKEVTTYNDIVQDFRNHIIEQSEEIAFIQQLYVDNIKDINAKTRYLKSKKHALKIAIRELKENHPEEVPVELSDSESSDNSSLVSERSSEDEIKVASSENSMKERSSDEDNVNDKMNKVKLTEESLSEMNIENSPSLPPIKSDLSITASTCATTATSEIGSENPTELNSPISSCVVSELKKTDIIDCKSDESVNQSTIARNRGGSVSMSRRASIAGLEDGSKSDVLKDKIKISEMKKQIKDLQTQVYI